MSIITWTCFLEYTVTDCASLFPLLVHKKKKKENTAYRKVEATPCVSEEHQHDLLFNVKS